MKFSITEQAAKWYKQEFDLAENTCLRFYIRYGGSGRIPGFSLGVKTDVPEQVLASDKKEDILFYIEASDAWYFEEHALQIDLPSGSQEPEIHFM